MRQTLAAFLLVIWASASGQATPEPSLVSALSRCDASFFKHLLSRQKDLAPQGPVQLRGAVGTFKVPNVAHPTDSKVFFGSPLQLHGLELIGYFDEVTPIPGGVAVSWGFLVASTVAEAAAKLKDAIWDATRLRTGERYFVRSEIWRHSNKAAGWSKEASEPGPPKPGTVERVFMIEPYKGETAYVRVGCSLQGEVSSEMMAELRPDFPMHKLNEI